MEILTVNQRRRPDPSSLESIVDAGCEQEILCIIGAMRVGLRHSPGIVRAVHVNVVVPLYGHSDLLPGHVEVAAQQA